MVVLFSTVNIFLILFQKVYVAEGGTEELECHYCLPNTASPCLQQSVGGMKCHKAPDFILARESSSSEELSYLKPTCFFVEYVDHEWQVKRKYSCANSSVVPAYAASDHVTICEYYKRMKKIDLDPVFIIRDCKICPEPLCNKNPGTPKPPPKKPSGKDVEIELKCYSCMPKIENCGLVKDQFDQEFCSYIEEYHEILETLDKAEEKYLKPKCVYLEFIDGNGKALKQYTCTNATIKNHNKGFVMSTVCEYFKSAHYIGGELVEVLKYCATCSKPLCNEGRGMATDELFDADSSSPKTPQKYSNIKLIICYIASFFLS